jgi:dihydrofolate reductase
MQHISLVVAYDQKLGIGKNNQMPWHLPSELAYFKAITMGKPIIMGRKTHESIGRVLPGRRNIVITSRPLPTPPGVELAASLDDALALCKGEPEIMVIGGGQIFSAILPRATRIFATEIAGDFGADVQFPAFDPAQWQEVRREHRNADDRNPHAYDIVLYERR